MSDRRLAHSPQLPTAGWRRWEMSSFVQHAIEDDAVPSFDEITISEADARADREARLAEDRERARQEGHVDGISAGRTEGYEAGHAEGLIKGIAAGHDAGHIERLDAAREQGAAEAQRLQSMAHAFAGAIKGLEEEMGQALLTMALDIARQVLHSQLSIQPESMIGVVREVIHTHCGTGGPHRLYLHPADLELVRQHLQEELTDAHWRLFADETITRGGCRAQTPHGEIDAQLETRWRRIAAALNRDSVWNTP
jgi:flagellar assembly protein FliH